MHAARERAPGVVLVGCSGWNYAHWRHGVFYPEGLPPRRWLDHYARVFSTVELNTTFYRLPRVEAVRRWVEETPPGFVFAVKASRYMTHVRRLRDLAGPLARFLERLEPLRRSPKLGPMLWQLPPTFRRDDDRLAAALAELPPGRHCVEFRHASWFAPDVYALLRDRGVALVIGDRPAVHAFQTRELTADWTFLRFHAGAAADGDYSDAELERWSAWIAAQAADGRDVYAYFNNDWQGFAVRNAMRLRGLLAADAERAAPAQGARVGPGGGC